MYISKENLAQRQTLVDSMEQDNPPTENTISLLAMNVVDRNKAWLE
jgi:hypothetical protein